MSSITAENYSPTQFLKHLVMRKQLGTTTQGVHCLMVLCMYLQQYCLILDVFKGILVIEVLSTIFSSCSLCCVNAVVLVNSWKSNLTRVGEYPGLLSKLIYLKDLVFVKFQIQKETTTAFTFFVLHHLK